MDENRTIHIVSHTHWDREWYRTFQQFRLQLVRLVDGLLEILAQQGAYRHFMLDGQTIVLDDYLAMRPEQEAALRRHVRSGRLLIGPWHILPDMFLVGPEAHIRNLLQGRRTARRFGQPMPVGYIPDPFGHPGQIPQILRGFGLEAACLWRGVDPTACEFWWQAPDGSRVLTISMRDGYGNGAELPAGDPPRFTSLLAGRARSLIPDAATSHLLVMLGTDHMEPPPETAQAIAYADRRLHPWRVEHSTLPDYLKAVRKELSAKAAGLPVIQGELRGCRRMPLLPGMLSTRTWIKQRNHAAETLLERWVEPLAAFEAHLSPAAAPRLGNKPGLIRQAWRLLMENHPHDSICGCSIDPVHDEMKVRFDQVEQIGQELRLDSLQAIAGSLDTQPPPAVLGPAGDPPPITALVVFNPLQAPRREVVSATLLSKSLEAFDLLDETGRLIPFQEEGLGTRQIARMTLDAQGIQEVFSNVHEGRAAGMSIVDLQIERVDETVKIEAVLAQNCEPDLAAYHAGRQLLQACLADPSLKTYQVRARSVSSQVRFLAPETPPHGYRTLWVRPRPAAPEQPATRLNPLGRALLTLAGLPFVHRLSERPRYARPPYRIENEFFTVEAMRNGTLSVLDRRDGVRYTGLNRFVDGGDSGDEYNYCPPAQDALLTPRLKHVTLQRGAVQQKMALELELTLPAGLAEDRRERSAGRVRLPLTSTVTLSQGMPRIEIRTQVENRARDHRLRVHFPAPFTAESGEHDGHFEIVTRPVGIPPFDASWVEQPRPEVPQRAFTSVTDGEQRLTIANRGLPEVEVLRNAQGQAEIALTLLRCVGWLSRDDLVARPGHAGPPGVETPGAQMQGSWEFEYAIIPGSGADAFEQAYAFQAPLLALETGLHGGVLPARMAFLEVGPTPNGNFVSAPSLKGGEKSPFPSGEGTGERFHITAIKPAEDGRGWVARGYNLGEEDIQVRLKPWRVFRKARLVNLAEEKLRELEVAADGSVSVQVGGHGIVSVKFGE